MQDNVMSSDVRMPTFLGRLFSRTFSEGGTYMPHFIESSSVETARVEASCCTEYRAFVSACRTVLDEYDL